MYNGDIAKWKKLANSLMLALSNEDFQCRCNQCGKEYVHQAVAGGVMTTNADNFVMPLATAPSSLG
ncbi:MAG: SusD/RagB family nutrient-binding outer membrane lipoprotein [Cyclobacteriaceae bacterium]|nr:SusD/RagB family nutrient-binding outer membrane lipoprotein [Cyclobacteriaceae bacterium]